MSNHRKGEEYPVKSGIIVTLKFNPSGSRAYRVDIPTIVTGKVREQRQFQTKEAARHYAAQRHLEITQFGHAAFAHTSRQRDDAARAIALLSPHGLTLSHPTRWRRNSCASLGDPQVSAHPANSVTASS